ncbi:MAG: glycosyltransferase family 39 protein [Acidobacteria bacterium]|nr:glycosyltransferase family 39 protein [Acidobacteriota bacterium]
MLCGYLIALGWQAWHVGLTFDEPARMLGSYLYWLNKPDLSPQDLPPLIKIVSGWVPRVLHIPLFPGLPCWRTGDKQPVALEILDRLSPEQIHELFFRMRLVLTIFPILTALLIWRWGRLLFGKTAGLLLLVAAVLLPTPLAHGYLVTSDMAATFTYLLFAFCGWRFWLAPDRKTSLMLGPSALLATLAKMSMIIVPILALLLVAARVLKGPRPLSRWVVWALASVLLIPYAGVITAYRFHTRRFARQEIAKMRARREFPAPAMWLIPLFRYVPTPREMQMGVRSLNPYRGPKAPFYMLGQLHSSGHWAYYPFALAVKTPVALQILFVGGLILVARRIYARRAAAADWLLLLPGLIYLALATQSDLQIGVRLVLPCIPFALLLGGFAIERGLSTQRGRFGLGVVFGWLAVAAVSIYPQGIAYFNEWVGGPDQGWKYLVDSNVDWGQNLPELAEYIRRNDLKGLKLFYFGSDKFHRYGILDRIEDQPSPWEPAYVKGKRLTPSPGTYAVSVTLLSGQYFSREYQDYFRYFRDREPDDRVGHSILIYRVK